jgi:hypothetical protein
MIVLSAGFGPSLLGFVNVKILRVTGAISVGFIALIIGGVKIPSNLPLIIIILGIVVGGIVR